MNVDISVIIPAFNRLWALPQTIASCRDTVCNTEIIVVDDGSTDGTAEWLNQQEGLVAIIQPNMGKCTAVNVAFETAGGKYIKFLDSDDQVIPGALDKQLSIAEAGNGDIVVSGYIFADEGGHVIREQPWVMCEDFIAQQLGECDSSHYSAYLFKKSFIADIPHRQEFCYRDDRLFVLEAALKHPKVSVCPGYTLIHTHHSRPRLQATNRSQQVLQNRQHLAIYQKILGRLKETDELNERRINAAVNILWPLCHWIAKDDINTADNLLNWIKEMHHDFKIPHDGVLGLFYRVFGFKTTERLLNIRRAFIR